MSAAADLVAQLPVDDLVPGDLASVTAFGTRLRADADKLLWAAEDQGAVTVTWTGEAAERYRARSKVVVKGWSSAAEDYGAAAKAMQAYADVLAKAKTDAGTAIGLFEDGIVAAQNAHFQTYLDAVERVPEGGQVSAYVPVSRSALATLGAGSGVRAEACDLLDSSRSAVEQEGQRAATVLAASTENYASDPPFGLDSGAAADEVPLDGPVPMERSDFDPLDIEQGSIGDCWLLAGLGGVASMDPAWLEEHIQANPDGSYTVTVYEKDGDDFRPVEVTVPPHVFDDGVRDVDADPSWASVYEYAAAQHYGEGREGIDGGNGNKSLELITGRPAQMHNDVALGDISDGLDEGNIYYASTEGKSTWWPFDDEVDDKHIVPGHGYFVDKVEERDGELKIHLLNPWGPDGGTYDGEHRYGELWLTEQEYHENFDDTSWVEGR